MNEEFEKMRAEFEDWYSALIGKTANLMRNDAYYDRPRYGNAKTDIAWLAWQSSRKQALSEAANKCDEWAALLAYDSAKCATAETCAEIIREMQKE